MKLTGSVHKVETIELELTPETVANQLWDAHQDYLYDILHPHIKAKAAKGMGAPDSRTVFITDNEVWIYVEWGRHPRNTEIREELKLNDEFKRWIIDAITSMRQVIEVSKHITHHQNTK